MFINEEVKIKIIDNFNCSTGSVKFAAFSRNVGAKVNEKASRSKADLSSNTSAGRETLAGFFPVKMFFANDFIKKDTTFF